LNIGGYIENLQLTLWKWTDIIGPAGSFPLETWLKMMVCYTYFIRE